MIVRLSMDRAAAARGLIMIEDVNSRARALVAALAIALGVGPAALDACVLSCEARPGQSQPGAAAACHHSDNATPGSHWKASAAPCGHDHHAIAATASVRDGRSINAAVHLDAVTANRPPCLTRFAASDIAPRARSHRLDPGAPLITPLRV
jgi:hypothetical protein